MIAKRRLDLPLSRIVQLLATIILTTKMIPLVEATHGVETGSTQIGKAPYAAIGDVCDEKLYETEMKPFHVNVATKKIMEAREIYEQRVKKIQEFHDDKDRAEYMKHICFGSALECKKWNATVSKCECLNLSGFSNFTFTESGGACKSGAGSVCTTQGFSCADDLKCDLKTDKCEKVSAAFRTTISSMLTHIPIFLMAYSLNWSTFVG